MIARSFDTTRIISDGRLTHSAARFAMERMSREIREIQYDSNTGSISIETMGLTELRFNKVSLSGTTSTISFNLSGTDLKMSDTAFDANHAFELAKNVSKLSFLYFKADGTTPASLSKDVRYVRISMTVAPVDTQKLQLDTQVNLRNT